MTNSVSVVIPCYKDAATLGRAIDSIYAQTYKVDEVIVVNDCSPESYEIETVVNNYKNIVYIKNASNIGLAATRNVGLYVSAGDVVCFLDADDQLHPQKIEIQLSELEPNVAVTSEVKIISDNDKGIDDKTYNKNYKIHYFSNSREILWKNKLVGASLLVTKALLLSFKGFDEELRSCEDYDLWFRMLNAGVLVKKIQLPLYIYHYNEYGLSKNYQSISYWETQVLKKYLKSQERGFLFKQSDAFVWSFWMIKHIFRYELSRNSELKSEIFSNISLLNKYPVLECVLNFLIKFRLFSPIYLFRNLIVNKQN
jgi:glycosyltransferase involved in cell wall biosynthesis